jgi:two-component system CheB/CheR fusion protein
MKKSPSLAPKKGKNKAFPIVAIGASAGGLEAVMELLQNLPTNTGMAFVYIQHLDPSHKSMLTEILSRVTKMKVQDAKHLMAVRSNNIYIIPPKKDLYIINHKLKLDNRKSKPAINLPIDKFFKSLAEFHSEGAIGIVLSGNASDGTIGLKEIKNAGGLTFAQNASAKFESMPRSAISEGCVDLVLSPKDIALELGRISKNTRVIDQVLQGTLEQNPIEVADAELAAIIELLRKSVGVDFQHYKPNTIKRRVIRRMLLYKLESLTEYLEHLKKNPTEINILFQDILINVTSFFRDPDCAEFLKKTILPKIIKSKTQSDSIRIWVPACSTGEEAYSIAIMLEETLSAKGLTIPIQIFASDLSDSAIAKARAGLYSKGDVADISAKRLQRFFTKNDGSYRINKVIRDSCVFAPHNVFADPPFSRLDLISCCNLMIYLDPFLQKKILSTFHYSLNPNGYLILGKSEALGTGGTLFSQTEKKYKVFIKKSDASNRVRFYLNHHLPELSTKSSLKKEIRSKPLSGEVKFEKTIEEILLSKYVPASVVVDKDVDVLQLHGPVSSFIEILPGKATLNLLKLVKPGIAFDLRNAIHKATKSNQPQKKTGIKINQNGSVISISIEVVPVARQNDERVFLIVFEKAPFASHEELRKSSFTKDQIVKGLQKELEAAKDDMRSILEEQEASNEELQSANEEIVSSNEELQSINEELETSKEEVESSNEELTTINNELQVRNEQLAEAQEFSDAVAETIREAVLVLDKDFRVRSANKAFYRIFRTKEENTEGMLIYELGERQWDIMELRQLLDELITKRSNIYGFEVTHDFPSIGKKTMLLHAKTVVQKVQQKQIIILAIEDITEHRMAQQAALEKEQWFRSMADNAPCMIWIYGVNKDRSFSNKTYSEFTGNKNESSHAWKEFIHPDDFAVYNREFEKGFKSRTPLVLEYRLKRADGQYRWMIDVAKPYYSGKNEFLGYIGTSTELHDKKMMLEELDKQVKTRTHELSELNLELQRSNSELEQFAYIASHDLQEPLRKILTYIDRIQHYDETLSDVSNGYFGKIIESSRRMTKLIDDLLDFSGISNSKIKFVNVDLNKTLKEVLSDLEISIAERKAEIEYDKNMPVIAGDPTQISQLFHNLITNALKFSRDEVLPKIKIIFRMLDVDQIPEGRLLNPKGSYVLLTISDNGIGFGDEFAEQIFVIFQRLNERKKYPGTGIGLALCKRIVSNHGGEIFAESNEAGAAFHVILPLNADRKSD